MFLPLPDAELQTLMAIKRGQLVLEPGALLCRQGEMDHSLYTVYDGWAIRFQTLKDGSEQVLDILLPGDTVGSGSGFPPSLSCSVRALTRLVVCILTGDYFTTLFKSQPELALRVLHANLDEKQRLERRLTALASMGAPQRIGSLFLDLRQRLRGLGMLHGAACDWPLPRGELASAVGLSKVHLMRALRELRTRGLADLRGRQLTVPNERRLAKYSDYTPPPSTQLATLL